MISFLAMKMADPVPAENKKGRFEMNLPFLSVYNLFLCPFSAAIAEEEDDASACPIGKEAPPYSDKPKIENAAKESAETNAEYPHCAAGNYHAKFHISGGAHAAGGDEGAHPEPRFEYADEEHGVHGHLRGGKGGS